MIRKSLHLQHTLMFVLLLLGISSGTLNAQTVVSTGIPSSPSSGSGGTPPYLSFIVDNSNSYDITITDIDMYRAANSSGMVYELRYSTTSLSGTPSVTSWTVIDTATQSTVTTTAIHPSFTGLNFNIPANTIYRFAVINTTSSALYIGGTASTPNSYSNGGVTIGVGNYQLNGLSVGYWSNNANYHWGGSVTFVPASACIAPPVAGTATASNASPCPGSSIKLNLAGGTGGLGQVYQWEVAASASGPFTPINAIPQSVSQYIDTVNTIPGNYYYRCLVDCGSNTAYSDTVMITIPNPFPGGTYTIDAGSPASSTNFQSFSDAVAAITCGITSPIVFNVAPGSGPYNEQINLPATIGSNASNTVTFNGNGNTLTMSTPTAANFATVNIDGADYITFNDLTIEALGSNGFGVHLMNGADNNSFHRCTISASPTGTSTASGCVSMSGSASSYSAGGTNGSNNLWDSCTLSGGYFGFYLYSVSGAAGDSMNNITNCTIKDYYSYGVYNYYQRSATISSNVLHRATRPSVSTAYGVYLSTGCANMLVEKNTIRDLYTLQPVNTNTSYALYCSSDGTVGRENKLFNNLIYNIEGSGTLYGMYLSGADYIQVYNNTIVLDDANATGGATYGIYNTGTVGGIDIQNNIVYITRGGSGDKYCLYYTGAGAKNSNYNDLYIASTSGNNNVGYNGSAQGSLSAWQSATGAGSPYDANSLDIDPIFINAISGNYAPANALLDNMGTPLASIIDDINGVFRDPATPDMGAMEFAVLACTGTPDSATAIGPSEMCSSIPFTVYATGLSVGIGITYDWEYNDGSGWYSTGIGGTSYTELGGILTPMDYRVITYCANSNEYDTSSVWSVALKPFYFCYCSPLTGNTLHTSTANYMTKVEIAGTSLSNTTAVVPSGGYLQTDPAIPSQTATVFENIPFTLNTTQSTTLATIEAWFDWDQSGTFDSWEYYSLTSTGTVATASVTPPMGFPTGLTGMRIRVAYNSPGAYGSGAACTNITAGRETEDYVINIAPTPTCPPPSSLSYTSTDTSADFNWASNSSAPQWQIEYGAGNFVLGTGTRVTTNLIPYTTPHIPYDTLFSYFVRDICGPNDTSLWSGRKDFYLLPPNDECDSAIDLTDGVARIGTTGGATQSLSACDPNTPVANDVWYSFTTSTGGSVTINATTPVADLVMQVYDGSCGALNALPPTASSGVSWGATCIDGPSNGTETGTFTVLANTTYYVRLYGYNGSEGTFTVQATGAPLAIKLGKLAATNIGNYNRIEWNTLSEKRSDKFELERSVDGKRFTKIYERQANGEASRYTYIDNSPVKGYNYYRLHMTEANGNAVYSEVVKVFVKSNGFEVEAYPNPVSDDLSVKVSGVLGADASVQVMDVTGKVIRIIEMTGNVEIINMSGFANGIYLIKYSDANHTQTIRVNKQ